MKKRILLLLPFIFCVFGVYSLESEGTQKNTGFGSIIVYAGYFGEQITHPGIQAGSDVTLFTNGKTDIFAGIQAGYYYHRLNSHGIFTQALIRSQRTFSSGFFLDAALGAGYLHSIPGGKVYEVVNGSTVEVKNGGNPNFMPSLSLGAGYKFWQKTPLPLALSFNTGIFGEYPFNTYLLPRVFISLTCFYRL